MKIMSMGYFKDLDGLERKAGAEGHLYHDELASLGFFNLFPPHFIPVSSFNIVHSFLGVFLQYSFFGSRKRLCTIQLRYPCFFPPSGLCED